MSMGNVSAVGAGQTQPGPGEAGSERISPSFCSRFTTRFESPCPAVDFSYTNVSWPTFGFYLQNFLVCVCVCVCVCVWGWERSGSK